MAAHIFDLVIIGGGPAGISAALTAKRRALDVLLFSQPVSENPLHRAKRIDNYPGLPQITGAALLETMEQQLSSVAVLQREEKVSQILPAGGRFILSAGNEMTYARALILAVGQTTAKGFSGEKDYLGRGVSYCATCDGMLFRKKKVGVIGTAQDSPREAEFLSSIGCEVMFFSPSETLLPAGIPTVRAANYTISGDGNRVTSLTADGTEYSLDGIFILRRNPPVAALVPGLKVTDGIIETGRDMSTSVPGVFAAGDCAGAPYQIAKAVGEGNIAALTADKYIGNIGKER